MMCKGAQVTSAMCSNQKQVQAHNSIKSIECGSVKADIL